MRLLEDNKKLWYGVAAAVVILLLLWPSFGRGRPGVVSFLKSDYNALQQSEKQNADQIARQYNTANPRLIGEITRVRESNAQLGNQFSELRSYVLFIPPMPFKIPFWEHQPGLKFLEIRTQAHSMELVRYARLRDQAHAQVEVADQFFGLTMYSGGVPPEKEKLPLLMRQLAMIDDLVRKAIDGGVRKIGRVTPLAPVDQGPLNKTPFLKLYPIRLEVTGPSESIVAFVNSLDGFHGKVLSAATKTRAEGDQVVVDTEVEISLGKKHGLSDGNEISFTIFDDVPDKEDGLRYKGRARVTQVLDDKCKAIVPAEALPPVEEKDLESRKIKEGDYATTNFYTLLDLNIEATQNKEGTANTITATVTAAGAGLLEDSQGAVGPVASVPTTGKGPRPNKIRARGF